VHVVYGSTSAFDFSTPSGVRSWRVAEGDLPVTSRGRFGYSFAVGRFNGDAYPDLAVGSPFATIGTAARAGSVTVLLGSATGFDVRRREVVSQNTTWDGQGVADVAEANDEFGTSLAAGKTSYSGTDILYVGVPGEGLSCGSQAGAVHVLYTREGATHLFDLTRDELLTRGNWDGAVSGDKLGFSLAVGDFAKKDLGQLAIGAPLEDVGGHANAGGVFIASCDAEQGLCATRVPDGSPQLPAFDQGSSAPAEPFRPEPSFSVCE
jgi:hypothetical protein